jgi:hypothetical protein
MVFGSVIFDFEETRAFESAKCELQYAIYE